MILQNGESEKTCYNMKNETRRDAGMTAGESTMLYQSRDAAGRVAAGPLGWSAVRRIAWAVTACAALWLAVLWALS